jgi:hypothetical protein
MSNVVLNTTDAVSPAKGALLDDHNCFMMVSDETKFQRVLAPSVPRGSNVVTTESSTGELRHTMGR